MGFSAKFSFRFIALILLSMSLYSCKNDAKDYNSAFNKKYGQEAQKMKAARLPENPDSKKEMVPLGAITVEEATAATVNTKGYYAYVDIAKFGDRSPQNYMPNGEVYEQTKAGNPANSLPPDMFEITYYAGLYPPFSPAGVEFDRINVPPQDVYGVQTKLSDKQYMLAGNAALQRSVDHINKEKTADDVEISEILIKEQKELRRRQKMLKAFGPEVLVEMVYLEEKSEQKEAVVMEKKKDDDKDQGAMSNFIKKLAGN